MGERKSREYLNKLKEKFGVDTLYSWSRYKKYKDDPYSYFLSYIKRVPEIKKDSIYGESGGHAHQILEDYYSGKIQREDMLGRYNDALFEMECSELKYNRMDKERNEQISAKYEASLKHFFENYVPLNLNQFKLEEFVTIQIGKYVFQGYIDFVFKDGDSVIIEDFKTSSIYTGKKLIEQSGQLFLYAQALNQAGIEMERIKIRYNFLKYMTVDYELKTIDKTTKKPKTRSKNVLRGAYATELEAQLRSYMTGLDYDMIEMEHIIATCKENNSFDTLPEEIRCKFNFRDCYVYVGITDEILNNLNEDIIATLDEIEVKTLKAKMLLNKIENEESESHIKLLEIELENMFETKIDKSKEYFFYNLLGYTRQQHVWWDRYLTEKATLKTEDSWDSEYAPKTSSDDDDWTNLL